MHTFPLMSLLPAEKKCHFVFVTWKWRKKKKCINTSKTILLGNGKKWVSYKLRIILSRIILFIFLAFPFFVINSILFTHSCIASSSFSHSGIFIIILHNIYFFFMWRSWRLRFFSRLCALILCGYRVVAMTPFFIPFRSTSSTFFASSLIPLLIVVKIRFYVCASSHSVDIFTLVINFYNFYYHHIIIFFCCILRLQQWWTRGGGDKHGEVDVIIKKVNNISLAFLVG